jgi:hypothetical protein
MYACMSYVYMYVRAIFNILSNPIIHCNIHNNPPVVPILIQINPVHTTLSYLSKIISILSFQPSLDLLSGLFLSDFPTKTVYTFHFFLIRATGLHALSTLAPPPGHSYHNGFCPHCLGHFRCCSESFLSVHGSERTIWQIGHSSVLSYQ